MLEQITNTTLVQNSASEVARLRRPAKINAEQKVRKDKKIPQA
jgi:hypothetical protein